MALSQKDIDALNEAIASGVRSVTLDGQTVTYNTTDSLIKARNDLVGQLAAQQPVLVRRPRQMYAFYAGRGNN